MKKWLAVLFAFSLVAPAGISAAAPAPGAANQIVATTVSLSPVADTYISGYDPNAAFGADGTFYLRTGGTEKGLVRFDLSTLPQGSNVLKAWLTVSAKLTQRISSKKERPPEWLETPLQISAYRLLRPWEPTTVTWLSSSATDAWGAPGADDTSTDRDSTALDSVTFHAYELTTELDVTSAAREWAANPESNHGLALTGSSDVSLEMAFYTSEATSDAIIDSFYPNIRPHLTVVYTDQPGTPVTVRYQNGAVISGGEYSGQSGTWISAWDPDQNMAGQSKLKIRSGAAYETLVGFDVQQAPVAFARLNLFTFGEPLWLKVFIRRDDRKYPFPDQYYWWLYLGRSMGFRNPYTLRAFELQRGWDAGTATWNLAAAGASWAAAGALDASDRLTPEIASTTVTWPLGWHSLDVTSAARSWASGAGDAGLILDAQSDTAVEHYFASTTYSDATKRPMLEVVYLLPTE